MSVVTLPLAATALPLGAPVRAPARNPVLFDYVSPARKVIAGRELDEVFRFRYRVFCEELHFFDPAAYPDGREFDDHDDDSMHFAAFNERREMVGTVRLVLGRPFPLEDHCCLFEDGPRLDDLRVAEVSRLAVPSRRGKAQSRLRECRNRQEIVVALYKGMILESRQRGLTHWVAAMEKTLQRVLKGLGCEFKPIGPEIDYSGPVTPYVAEVARLWQQQRMTYLY